MTSILDDPQFGNRMITLMAAFVLVLQIAMVGQRWLITNIRIFAAQSFLLAGIANTIAWYNHAPHIYIAAVLTLTLKAMLLPILLERLVKKVGIGQEIAPLINVPISLLISGGLTTVGYVVAASLRRPEDSASPGNLGHNTLAVAVSLFLIGFYMMIVRRRAFMQVLALLSLENGLFLAAISLTAFRRPSTQWTSASYRSCEDDPLMILLLILIVPLIAGALALLARRRAAMEAINLTAFGVLLVLAAVLTSQVLRAGTISAWNGFLAADALSALVVLLTAVVSLACSVYAIGYFRDDERNQVFETGVPGEVTHAQLRKYYSLTPLFVFAMLMVALANNLGVMWVAIEGTTLATVFLITFYGRATSIEAAWKSR